MPPQDIDRLFSHLRLLEDHLTLATREYDEAKAMAMPTEVLHALAAIDATHLPQIQELTKAIGEIENQLTYAVGETGTSARGHGFHAVYIQGRVSWDDAFLQGYAITHDEILQARREGTPSVSLSRLT